MKTINKDSFEYRDKHGWESWFYWKAVNVGNLKYIVIKQNPRRWAPNCNERQGYREEGCLTAEEKINLIKTIKKDYRGYLLVKHPWGSDRPYTWMKRLGVITYHDFLVQYVSPFAYPFLPADERKVVKAFSSPSNFRGIFHYYHHESKKKYEPSYYFNS